MPSYIPRACKSRPWRAVARRGKKHFFLGYYTTKEEAETVESDFRRAWPKRLDVWDQRVQDTSIGS